MDARLQSRCLVEFESRTNQKNRQLNKTGNNIIFCLVHSKKKKNRLVTVLALQLYWLYNKRAETNQLKNFKCFADVIFYGLFAFSSFVLPTIYCKVSLFVQNLSTTRKIQIAIYTVRHYKKSSSSRQE